MIDPQDSPTQEVDEVLRPNPVMESAANPDETGNSHNQIQIMYNKTNDLAGTIESVKTESIVKVTHTAKTVRTLAEFPPKPTTPCLEWKGSRLPSGYGVLFRDRRTFYAHRLAWEESYGPIPKGRMICHACDNRACYRVDHLWMGTQADNMGDCKAKDRKRGRPPKLSEERMRAIAAEPGACTAVAARHGIGKDSVLRWRKHFDPALSAFSVRGGKA